MTAQERRQVVGDGCQCWVTPESTWTRYGSAVEPGSQVEQNPQCRQHPSHALAIWCSLHRVVEPLDTRQAEHLIHGLFGRWFDETSTEPEGVIDYDELNWCPTQLERSLSDPEMYAEHIESNVDARIVAELGPDAP